MQGQSTLHSVVTSTCCNACDPCRVLGLTLLKPYQDLSIARRLGSNPSCESRWRAAVLCCRNSRSVLMHPRGGLQGVHGPKQFASCFVLFPALHFPRPHCPRDSGFRGNASRTQLSLGFGAQCRRLYRLLLGLMRPTLPYEGQDAFVGDLLPDPALPSAAKSTLFARLHNTTSLCILFEHLRASNDCSTRIRNASTTYTSDGSTSEAAFVSSVWCCALPDPCSRKTLAFLEAVCSSST